MAGMRAAIVAGGGVTALVAAGLVLGLGPSEDSPVRDALGVGDAFGPPSAQAAEALQPFTDCEELRRWYVDQALPQVTAWGLGGYPYPVLFGQRQMSGAVAELANGRASQPLSTAALDSATKAVGSGETGTNVQEAGVDEPDRAKTDGTLVYSVGPRGNTVQIHDTSGSQARLVGELDLPKRMTSPELLLAGDHLQVISEVGGWYYPAARIAIDSVWPGPGGGATRVLDVDVSEPATPEVLTDRRYDGSLLSARLHDGVVRLVLTSSSPMLDFVRPTKARTPREAKAANRAIVRDTTIEDWLPHVRRDDRPGAVPLLECGDVRHPKKQSGLGTITVVGYDVADSANRSTTAVTAAGDLVYSSLDQLYLATSQWGWSWGMVEPRGGGPKGPVTDLHAFDLDGMTTTYAASGSFRGVVRDRWSFDAVDGLLRVAAGVDFKRWQNSENAVIVFRRDGDELVETGRVAGLGKGEEIQSVRFFDDLAVLVTFEQVDPLYTVDVSGPVPRLLGELKIPGFSSYLHPIGDDRLLGLGTDTRVVDRGRRSFVRTVGAKISAFDISDLAAPAELDAEPLGRATHLGATDEPRAFTWLPDAGVGFTPVESWSWPRRDDDLEGLLEVRVAADGTVSTDLRLTGRKYDAWSTRVLPLADGRVAVVEGDSVALLTP